MERRRLNPQLVRAIAVATAIGFAAGCARSQPRLDDSQRADVTYADVEELHQKRSYFALRNRLRAASDTQSAPVHFARAIIAYAFNDPSGSNDAIRRLLERSGVPDSAVITLREMAMTNHLRLFQYAEALKMAELLLTDSVRLGARKLGDVRNMQRIFRALEQTPAQTVSFRGVTRVQLAEGRLPVTINDTLRNYVFDTGANLSTIMRSEAAALGLRTLSAGIDVGTSTDRRVTADLAVAERLTIGAMDFRNVVFLLLDDAMLTFGDVRIPGIIGFPVISQMGEVHLNGARELFIPATAPRRSQGNLSLSGLTLLTPVHWNGSQLLCRLDTGANTTNFYEPFYRRFRAIVDSIGAVRTRRTGGAGGMREFPVRVLSNVRLELGDTIATVRSADVLLQSIARYEEDNYLDCNVGHDILDAFPTMVLNFRDMVFLLR